MSQAINIIQSANFSEKLSILFSQDGEHRLVFTRLSHILSYALFGDINFKFLVIFGNTALVALFFLFLKTIKVPHATLLYFIPISILLFQLQSWKNMIWAQAALQHQYILVFTGLTFYFLGKYSNRSFYSAFFFAVVSVFTHGSGLATIFIGWVALLISKRYRQSAVWAIGAFILGLFYFKNFYTITNVFAGTQSLAGLKNLLMYFFSYLGSSISLNEMPVAVGFGVVLSFYLCFLTKDKYFERNLTVYVFMTHIFFHAALVAIARSDLGLENVFSPRYKIDSVVLVILVYISLADRFSLTADKFSKFVSIGILFAATSYYLTFNPGKDNLETRSKSLTWMANQWVNTNHGFFFRSAPPGAEDRYLNSMLLKAIEGGFYELPYEILGIPDSGYSSSVILPKTCEMEKRKVFKTKFSITPIGPESHPYLIRLEGIIHHPISNKTDNNATIHLILKSKNGSYTFETHPQHYLHGSVFFEKELSNVGFIALIPFEKIEKGLYRIGFCDGKSINFEGKVLLKN